MLHERISQDIPVVAVEYDPVIVDIGAERAKAISPGYRYRYSRKHTLILKDGQRVEGEVRGLTNPKLAERVTSEQRFVANGCVFCSQWSDGNGGTYWSTCTKVTIGVGM